MRKIIGTYCSFNLLNEPNPEIMAQAYLKYYIDVAKKALPEMPDYEIRAMLIEALEKRWLKGPDKVLELKPFNGFGRTGLERIKKWVLQGL